MFALFALFGDLGCMSGPTMVGILSEKFDGSLKKGLLFAIIFPVVLIGGVILCKKLTVEKAADTPLQEKR